MHWTLDDVRNMDAEDYDELVAWAQKRAERAENPDSMDMDDVIEAKRKKAQADHE